jgi:uncharacterized protein (TIGR01244 family)
MSAVRTQLLAAALAAFACSACRTTDEDPPTPVAPVESVRLGSLDNCYHYGEVYVASQPDANVLELLERRGFVLVVDLRTALEERALPVAATARRLGLPYEQVPIALSDLSDANVDRALALLEAAERGPMLVFCDTGARAALVLAIELATRGGLEIEEALAEGRAAGMKPGAPEAAARRQIERVRARTAASAQATSASTTNPSSSASRQAGGSE